jgi:WD40 repeat protein
MLSSENVIKVWDFHSGVELFTLAGHSQKINAVAVTPNSQYIVSASDDATIRVWDLKAATQLRILTGHTQRINAVVVTLDGQRIISASDDNTLKIGVLMMAQSYSLWLVIPLQSLPLQ